MLDCGANVFCVSDWVAAMTKRHVVACDTYIKTFVFLTSIFKSRILRLRQPASTLPALRLAAGCLAIEAQSRWSFWGRFARSDPREQDLHQFLYCTELKEARDIARASVNIP